MAIKSKWTRRQDKRTGAVSYRLEITVRGEDGSLEDGRVAAIIERRDYTLPTRSTGYRDHRGVLHDTLAEAKASAERDVLAGIASAVND